MSIKISELPQATSVGSSDIVPIVQGGTTKQVEAGVINPELQDTGWVAISSYLTSKFSARGGTSSNWAPYVRRIGNIVYFKGEVYCNSSVGNSEATIISGLPTYFCPTEAQYNNCGVRWKSNPFMIYANNSGSIIVGETSNITTQQEWQGYSLSNLSGMHTDNAFPTELLTATRSLNLTRSENTGSLVGLGDKAEVTDETLEKTKLDEVTEVKEVEPTEEIEESGDKGE